jgi:hypothetical protein
MITEGSANAPAQMHMTDRSVEVDQAAYHSSPTRQAAFKISMVCACLGGTGSIISPVLGHVVSGSAGFITGMVSLGICAFSGCLLPYANPPGTSNIDPENRGS